MDQFIDKGQVILNWHFQEFEKPERGPVWYIVMFALAIGLLIYSIIFSNFLFAVVIVMFVVIVLMHDRKVPSELEIKIMDAGIEIGDKFFQYKDLKEFFIIYEPPVISNLFIRPKNKMTPTFNIPLLDQNPIKVREILMQFLDEDVNAEEEPTSDFLARLLKL